MGIGSLNTDNFPRIYLKDHPWIDYYQETPCGTLITPKIAIKKIQLSCTITKEGATFVELVESYNEKTNDDKNERGKA